MSAPKSRYWFGSDPTTVPLDYSWVYYPRDLAKTFSTDDNKLVNRFLLSKQQQNLINRKRKLEKYLNNPATKLGIVGGSFVVANITPSADFPRFGALRNIFAVGYC